MDKPEWGVGSKSGALWGLIKEFLPLLILPIVLFTVMGWVMESGDVNATMEDYKGMIMSAAIFAIPLIILSIPLGYYAKGNSARIAFAFIFPIYTGIWIWLFTNGGNFPVTLPPMSIGSLTLSSMEIVLNIRTILYIVMVICFLKGLLAFTEYSKNREKFQEKLKKDSL